MSVALRYVGKREDAEEVLNESFLKVFTKLDQYDKAYDFKKWFRKILINTSIDHHRKYNKLNVDEMEEDISTREDANVGLNNLLYEDILKQIQRLPPSYRLVFNLYVIDGFKHHEIAEQLNILSEYFKIELLQERRKTSNLFERYRKENRFNNNKK